MSIFSSHAFNVHSIWYLQDIIPEAEIKIERYHPLENFRFESVVDSGITTGFSTQLWLFSPLRSISYEEIVRAYRRILHDRCRLVLDADLVQLRAAYSSWVEASRNETAKENGERWSTTRSFAGCIISRKTRQWETKASAISISRPINYYFFRHSTDATFYRC